MEFNKIDDQNIKRNIMKKIPKTDIESDYVITPTSSSIEII